MEKNQLYKTFKKTKNKLINFIDFIFILQCKIFIDFDQSIFSIEMDESFVKRKKDNINIVVKITIISKKRNFRK